VLVPCRIATGEDADDHRGPEHRVSARVLAGDDHRLRRLALLGQRPQVLRFLPERQLLVRNCRAHSATLPATLPFLLNAATTGRLTPQRARRKPPRERRLCEGRTVAGNPTPWRVEIAPDEFKLFGDCTRDDLEAATTLIEDRAADRQLSAGYELGDEVLARRLLMGLTDQQRNLFAVLEVIKMVDGEQLKREDV